MARSRAQDALKQTDVLIIGAGGAGLRAAIELHDNGINVLIVGKSKRKDAHTVMAAGGINAALGTMDPEDNWRIHAADTLREGQMINDPELVMGLCKNAPSAIKELEKWGIQFHREPDGRLTQRFFGAHTYRRTCFYGDETGKEIIRVLNKEVEARKIPMLSEMYITCLLKKNKRVIGALGIDANNDLCVFAAKAVVLATGGHSRCYSMSTSRFFENTGDGIALGFEAGATLMDMEMVQFHPTGMVWPKNMEGTLVSEAVRGEGGKLFNAKNERFMKHYDPERMELGPRDKVARAVIAEILAGRGTRHNGVWLDITHRPASYLKARLFGVYERYKKLGIDITKERMEVAPTAHYSMGGIRVNPKNFSTGVPGLFAIGEITGGVHGGNRLGGNSLAEILVYGRLIGKVIANTVKKQKQPQLAKEGINLHQQEIVGLLAKNKGKNPVEFKKSIQHMMWENAGVFRDIKRLNKGLTFLTRARKDLEKVRAGKDVREYLDSRALLVACEAILRSALMRKESRAAHFRTDYPKRNDAVWKVNIVCKKVNRQMKLAKVRIKPVPKALRAILQKKFKPIHHLLE